MISKKGSSIVEAVFIFPIIILVLVALISIVAYMYKSVEKNVATHIALTNAIGIETETTYYFGKIPSDIYIVKESKQNFVVASARTNVEIVGVGIFKENLLGQMESIGSGRNEKEYILEKDFLRRIQQKR